MTRRRRGQRAWSDGRRAERLGVWWLRLKGYRIVGQRVRVAGVGEIDIIARRGKTLAFIEVKKRADQALAAESVSPHQRRRIMQAAQSFARDHPNCRDLNWRFDVLLVADGRLRHVTNAWQEN